MATNTTTTTTATPPPPDFDFNATCRFFKSSFARTLSLNNGNNNNNNNNNNMNCRSLDFDLNQHFNRNNNKTDNGLEVANKQPQAKRISTKEVAATNLDIDAKNEVNNTTLLVDNHDNNVDVDVDSDGQKNKIITTTTTTNKELPANLRMEINEKPTLNKFYKNSLKSQQQQQSTDLPWQLYLQLDDIHENNATTTTTTSSSSSSSTTNFNRKTVWSRNINNNNNKQNLNAKSTDDTTDMSADVAANKNRNINCNIKSQQQQQQQQQQTQCNMLTDSPASKVETVLLRNQVDTLQWQLKQVETSCEMYRAVMQEVARFLERYQAQKQQRINQNSMEQISRSKSLYQVYAAYYDNKTSTLCGNEAPQSANHLRAKSSNNLIDMNAKTAKTTAPIASITTARQPIYHNSYSAFKDFTWRRSPKKLNGHNGQLPLDEAEEKLSQEGFRLFRTIQNLLNTSIQQPDLTQHRNSLSTINLGRLTNTTTANNQNNNNNNIGKNIICDHTKLKTEAVGGGDLQNSLGKPKTAMSTVADMLFMRSNNMRDSRLSMRSSTDSSVHSTTSSASSSSSGSSSSSSCVSSKVETDEEATISPTIKPTAGGSTTEDESGFSSINSFQDVGVPAFSSTLIERRPSSASCASVRPKSMPPQQSKHPNNIVGLPDTATHVWDVKPTPLHNNPGYQITRKFQRYSTISTEETGTVLWV